MTLRRIAATATLALVGGNALAAPGETVVKEILVAAAPALGPTATVASGGLTPVGWIAIDQTVAPAPTQPLDARQPAAAGRAVPVVGVAAAATTSPSFIRLTGSRTGAQEGSTTAEPGATSETPDTGVVILAGLGIAGLLALRRTGPG